jgi:branched-chain amino acid transport system substrate-binding protein
VKFAPNGEWEKSRVLWVQLQNIESRDISEFSKPGKMVVIYPDEYKSGELVYPFPGWQ